MKKTTIVSVLELVLGVILLALGILAIMNPGTALSTFVAAYAIGAVLMGIIYIIFYIRRSTRTGFASALLLVNGILNIALGILLLFNNSIGTWVLLIAFPIWFIMGCIARLANIGIFRAFNPGYYWFSLILNILGIILGVLLLFRPFASVSVLVYMVGFYLIFIGIDFVISAFVRFGNRDDTL